MNILKFKDFKSIAGASDEVNAPAEKITRWRNRMNEAVYQMAAMGGSARIVVQKKPDGNFILGVSNGKENPLICQGTPEAINNDFATRLPDYLEKIKNAAIEAKLNAAAESQPGPETLNTPAASVETNENDQPELDFGF